MPLAGAPLVNRQAVIFGNHVLGAKEFEMRRVPQL